MTREDGASRHSVIPGVIYVICDYSPVQNWKNDLFVSVIAFVDLFIPLSLCILCIVGHGNWIWNREMIAG